MVALQRLFTCGAQNESFVEHQAPQAQRQRQKNGRYRQLPDFNAPVKTKKRGGKLCESSSKCPPWPRA
jgi:hypothetical protein